MKETKPTVLVVDDDPGIREPLVTYLEEHGFRAKSAVDGRELDQVLRGSRISVIVLDVMLPDEDGYSICRRLRETSVVPIIMLTSRAEDIERIVGLELGADDFVAKPFNPRELLARIKSVLRRTEMLPPQHQRTTGIARFAQWRFDVARKQVLDAQGVVVRLSSSEHALLTTLLDNAGLTLSRDQLLDLTKGRDTELFDRSIDTQISRLRRKLRDDPKDPRIIVTEWGGGYRFAAEFEWVNDPR
ncbi:MAG: response regulator [Myxococcota bacterium]